MGVGEKVSVGLVVGGNVSVGTGDTVGYGVTSTSTVMSSTYVEAQSRSISACPGQKRKRASGLFIVDCSRTAISPFLA